MGMTVTTIKVPIELRDRLAARAKHDNVTMARVITQALDEAEEREFWERVRAENALITDEERAERVHDSTLLDDLDDPVDEDLSRRGAW
jgi:predicted transcriptional regulator